MGRSRAAEAELSERRFYVPDLGGAEGEIALSREALRHAQVLRLGLSDELELFDGAGHTLRARISRLDKHGLSCVGDGPALWHPQGPRVVLVQCLPKATKLDDIVRMTTELGVSEVRLCLSERCQLKGDVERMEAKLERLTRIAIEALRQSEQTWLPRLSAPRALEEVLAEAPEGPSTARVACVERTDIALDLGPAAEEAWLVIGPEGGLSERDRGILSECGFSPAGLGRSILRTETAAVVGVALALDRLRQRR